MLLENRKNFKIIKENCLEIWTKSKFLCYNITVMTDDVRLSEIILPENGFLL
jgi:hypothetical protein